LLAVFLIVAGYLIYRVAGLLRRLFGRRPRQLFNLRPAVAPRRPRWPRGKPAR
jgi:hypothetical protein